MDPVFYTRKATAPFRERFANWKNSTGRRWWNRITNNKSTILWSAYWIIAFLTFGYQMNHFVGTGPDGVANTPMTVLGSLISAVGWPLLFVTWMFK